MKTPNYFQKILDITLLFLYYFPMGRHRRKHKHFQHNNQNKDNQPLHISRGDKTILGYIALLSCPAQKFSTDLEKEISFTQANNFHEVLHNAARRVAECILDKDKQENNRVRNGADRLMEWAKKFYEIKTNQI